MEREKRWWVIVGVISVDSSKVAVVGVVSSAGGGTSVARYRIGGL